MDGLDLGKIPAENPAVPECATRAGALRPSGLVVRNVRVGGRRTSVSLEQAFWDALQDIARRRSLSIHEICTLAHAYRGTEQTLTSALRTYVLAWYIDRERAARPKSRGEAVKRTS